MVRFLAPLFFTSLLLAQNGRISGVVSDDSGKPVGNLWVTATRAGLPPFSASTATAVSGAYEFANLPSGDYRLCAQSPTGDYMDSCTSNPPVPSTLFPQAGRITAQTGKPVTGAAITVKRAAKLQVRVADPQNQMRLPGKGVLIGVMTGTGLYRGAVQKSIDAGGRLFEISVPPGEQVRLMVTGVGVLLTDPSGRAAGTSTVSRSGSGIENPVQLIVTGVQE